MTTGDRRLEVSGNNAPVNLTMEFAVRQCSTRCMGQETCEKCGRGKPGHLPQTCAKNLAARQVEESNRVAQEQRDQRLVNSAARVASRKTAVVIALGALLGVGVIIALLASETGNAKEPAVSAAAGPTAAAASAAPRPGIVLRPRHP